ncbi:MAG: TRAP transporter small permease [Spirochaetales bacterium]|nr:TRAP transporter small permease [Spirochaetales bacterium]
MPKHGFPALLERVYHGILIALTATMFTTVAYNVFMRFVVNRSVGWADELSRFVFIWISFLGAVLAFRNGEHVGLTFLVDKVRSAGVRRALDVARHTLVLIVLLFLTWFGYRASTTVLNVSPALSIPMNIVYLIVPFCGLLMSMLGLVKLVRAIVTAEPLDDGEHTAVE